MCLCAVRAGFFFHRLFVFLSRLRDGRSIRTVSALLLQLVQTSAHDVRIEARKIDKARQNKFALRRQESFSESQPGPPEPFLDENDQGVCVDLFSHIFQDPDFLIFFCCSQEIRLYGTGLDSAVKAAKTMIIFLTQRWVLPVWMKLVLCLIVLRSGKGKTTKNSNEAEYRLIFDNLIDDLLVVLFWPEWPAASLILSIASKFMVLLLVLVCLRCI